MKHFITSSLFVLACAVIFLLPQSVSAHTGSFEMTDLQSLYNRTVPANLRIAQGIAYLKKEIASPRPAEWGPGGGPIDSEYVQDVIVETLAFPGSENPEALRHYRDTAPNRLLKDLLTVSLGLTGAQDTAPNLIRIAHTNTAGSIRLEALRALTGLCLPPKTTDVPPRIKPGEIWRPLDVRTQQAVRNALVGGLQDNFSRFRNPDQQEETAYFPVQEQAAELLRHLGYGVQATPLGWQVLDKQGQILNNVAVNRGRSPFPKLN